MTPSRDFLIHAAHFGMLAMVAATKGVLVFSDRGRTEERLMERAFGDAYRTYAARTSRFLPGVY